MFVGAVLVFYYLSSDFLSYYNVKSMLELFPELGIVVIGVTVLMIGGEFDLSVGSVFALSPILVVSFVQLGLGAITATVLTMILCALIGLLNGIITLATGMPSFITTLATMMFWRGTLLAITEGSPPSIPESLVEIQPFFVGWMGYVRASVIHLVVIVLVLWFVLERTRFGNWIFAVGGKPEAARARGIDPGRVKLILFSVVSFLAGLAGLIQALRIKAALPSAGEGWALDAIAAAVIGGCSLFGGIGSVIGAEMGAFLIRIIDNGLVLAGAPGYYFRMFIGLVILVAVTINIYIRRKSEELG